jgi:hypothetical protein
LDKNKCGKKFEQILQDSIDEAFLTLGESVKTAIYFHLEHKFMIVRQEIPSRIDDFSDSLERIFGLGARHLEVMIMKNLHNKISCFYEWNGPNWLVPDLTFKQYVELARLCYEDKRKIGEIEVLVIAEEKQEQHV